MTWLADLLRPQPKHEAPMTIELASPETNTSAQPSPATAEPVVIEAHHPRLATADALDDETLERHLIARMDPKLQIAAMRVAAEKSRLADITSAQSALSQAEDARHFAGWDPELWLRDELEAVQAEIAAAEAGVKRSQARYEAYRSRVMPLQSAVSELHGNLVRERDLLNSRIDLLKRDGGISRDSTIHLRKAGLTPEQIASLGTVDPGARDLERYEARIAETAPKVSAIERWIETGRRDHRLLDGLGIDPALIEAARPVGEEAAP